MSDVPRDPNGYAIDRQTALFHRRYAEHARGLPRVRTVAELRGYVPDGSALIPCGECWPATLVRRGDDRQDETPTPASPGPDEGAPGSNATPDDPLPETTDAAASEPTEEAPTEPGLTVPDEVVVPTRRRPVERPKVVDVLGQDAEG